MPVITTRYASFNDAELIADMSRKTFYETFASRNTKENMAKFMNEMFTKEALMKEVGSAGNIFFLALDGEEPVGYVRMRKSDNPPGTGKGSAIEIARIYAVTHAIGKGVGKALMQKCIETAEEKEYQVIWLAVWEQNQRAVDFYTQWGFEKFGTHIFMLGDDPQSDWLMKKELKPVLRSAGAQ